MAKTALEQLPDSNLVTIRAMRLDKLAFTADVTRDRLSETQSADWQQQASSPDAWIEHVLSNEWPSKNNQDGVPPAGTASSANNSGQNSNAGIERSVGTT